MKRKTNKIRHASKGNKPWRMMLCLASLWLFTSMNGMAQSAGLSITDLQNLQTQINLLENKLANPLTAGHTSTIAEITSRIGLLQAALDHGMLSLQLANPNNAATQALAEQWLAWQQQQEVQQALDLTIITAQAEAQIAAQAEAVSQDPTSRTNIQNQYNQQQLQNQSNTGPSLNSKREAPVGTHSFDPTKTP